MPGAWTLLAAIALLRMQAVPEVVVTTAPSMDAQRLADALRVYLDEYGIRVQTRVATDAADLQARLDDARALGAAVRAVAVVRAEHGAPGSVEIDLVDLATGKALVVSVPRPQRDEDLYRALALKIQAVLRATLSEARADLPPGSSLGRLVESGGGPPPARTASRLGLDFGYGIVSFPNDGPLFGGLAVRASWRPRPRAELALGTAALGSDSASTGMVDATATIVPVRASARIPFAVGRGEILLGPCAEATYIRVAASSATTLVRSTRNLMIGLGVEAEVRIAVLGFRLAIRAGRRAGRAQRRALRRRGIAAVRHVAPSAVGNCGGGGRTTVIFLLTKPSVPSTMEGVRTMTDPSRPPAPEVAALVDRARRRDPEAFRDLFQAHVGAVHRVVRRMVGGRPDVEDLVQTAFVEAFRSLPDFRGDALFSTWLTRIAVRVTMRSVRRRHPPATPLDDVAEPVDATAGPERVAAARETLALVEAVLAELRPKRRAAFVLHVLEGYSMEEVAAIVSASTSAVKVRVHDARRHIERRLKQRPDVAALIRSGGVA